MKKTISDQFQEYMFTNICIGSPARSCELLRCPLRFVFLQLRLLVWMKRLLRPGKVHKLRILCSKNLLKTGREPLRRDVARSSWTHSFSSDSGKAVMRVWQDRQLPFPDGLNALTHIVS